MFEKGLFLLFALADVPAPAAEAPPPAAITEADLGPDYVGYLLFDPGLVEFNRLQSVRDYGNYLTYRAARDALESYEACLQVGADNHAQIEAAYQQLVNSQQRYVSAAQWRDLRQALRARREPVPERVVAMRRIRGQRALFRCGVGRCTAGRHRIGARAGRGRDSRSDALRPVLGVQMGARP